MAYNEHHKQDIISGRGPVFDNHHGNQQFRSMVDAQRPQFVQIARKGKRSIALDIMQEISSLEPSGRFLMESKGIAPSTNSENDSQSDDGVHPQIFSKAWLLVDHKKAMEKVLHPGGRRWSPAISEKK